MLWAAWTEDPHGQIGTRLRLAWLDESDHDRPQWRQVGPMSGAEVEPDDDLQLLGIRGRPCIFVYDADDGWRLHALTRDGWVVTDQDDWTLPADTAQAFDGHVVRFAAHGDAVYAEVGEDRFVPRRMQGSQFIPDHTEERSRVVEFAAEDDGGLRFVRVLALTTWRQHAPREDLHPQPHDAPLLTQVEPNRIRVLRIVPAEGGPRIDHMVDIGTPDEARQVVAVQLHDSIVVAARTGGRLVLFRVRGSIAAPVIEPDPGPAYADEVEMIAGPTGMPLLTFTDEHFRAVALGQRPASPPT